MMLIIIVSLCVVLAGVLPAYLVGDKVMIIAFYMTVSLFHRFGLLCYRYKCSCVVGWGIRAGLFTIIPPASLA